MTAPDPAPARPQDPIGDPLGIGVVGGLGPYAGLDLVRKLFDDTVAVRDQDHLPVVLINFPGYFPDRSAYIADPTRPNPVPALAEVLRRLEAAGCAIAGLPCNTAHAPVIFDVLNETMEREGRRIRLVNMIDASARTAQALCPDARRVGVLGTSSTVRTRLYHEALGRLGLEAVVPSADVQRDLVDGAIFDEGWGIKAQSDPVTPRARQALLDATEHLIARGAEVVILGCTELPLAVPELRWGGVPLVDSTRSLARALIEATHPDRVKPLPGTPAAEAAGDGAPRAEADLSLPA